MTVLVPQKTPLDKLDSWIDALKDLVLVPVGVIASYFALVQIGSVSIVIAIAILTLSVFSTIFVPYKIALIKSNELGVFTRLRALTMMVLVTASWSVPSILMISDNALAEFITTTNPYSPYRTILIPFLAIVAVAFVFVMEKKGVEWILRKAGMHEKELKRNLSYPWLPSYYEFFIVSFFVIQAQIDLVRGVSYATIDTAVAANHYSFAFGALLLLTVVLCFFTYYEPKRSWTGKGKFLSGLIILGAFLAVVQVVIGFAVSLISIIILEIYSSRLPEIDIDKVTLSTKQEELGERIALRIYMATYPRLSRATLLATPASLIPLLIAVVFGSMVEILVFCSLITIVVGVFSTQFIMKKSLQQFSSANEDVHERFRVELKKLLGPRYDDSVFESIKKPKQR